MASRKKKISRSEIRKLERQERLRKRREKKELSRLKWKHRRKLMSITFDNARKRIISFLKNPFPKKEMSRSEKIRREAFREAQRRMIIEWITGIPFRTKQSFLYFFQKRRFQWESIHARLLDFRENTLTLFSTSNSRKELFTTFAHSLSAFLISFVILYLLDNLITIFTASFFDIPAVLYQSKVFWPLSTYSTLYYREALIAIFGIAPVLMLLFGIFIFAFRIRNVRGTFFIKLLWIWTFLNAINLFFGAYIDGVITRSGFIYASEWTFLTSGVNKTEIIFTIIFVILMLLAGILTQRKFLNVSFSDTLVQKPFRFWNLFFIALLPWLTGTIILLIFALPHLNVEFLLLPLFAAIPIFPVFIGYKSPNFDTVRSHTKLTPLFSNTVVLATGVLLLAVIYIWLFNGVSFN